MFDALLGLPASGLQVSADFPETLTEQGFPTRQMINPTCCAGVP
jgi:hypothetical protein